MPLQDLQHKIVQDPHLLCRKGLFHGPMSFTHERNNTELCKIEPATTCLMRQTHYYFIIKNLQSRTLLSMNRAPFCVYCPTSEGVWTGG